MVVDWGTVKEFIGGRSQGLSWPKLHDTGSVRSVERATESRVRRRPDDIFASGRFTVLLPHSASKVLTWPYLL